MSYIKTSGIVVKGVNTGEADKILTLITTNYGKITAAARGARRPKSNLVAGSQFLCYSNYLLYKGKGLYIVNSCDVIESFYDIRNDLEKLTYSAHLADLVNDVMQENLPSLQVLKLFLNTLHVLMRTNKSPQLITAVFELRLLSVLGFAPSVEKCTVCGKEIGEYSFSFNCCGLACRTCRDSGSIDIKIGTARAVKHILLSSTDQLFKFELSAAVLSELSKLVRKYLIQQLEKEYKKLDYLSNL